tara:strand:- start:4398 stop:5393 length:996 start_codon:yes stop_codon:yes gene_type:complete
MSVFGPNQVEELIIGTAKAAETAIGTFIASATNKEIAVVSTDGSATVADGDDFKLLQKTAAGYEFSDVIKNNKVDSVTIVDHVAEVQKSLSVSAFAPLAADHTYAVEVRLYNDGGTLSPENFTTITGYYVSGAAAPSATDVSAGIVSSLNANLTRRGGNEITVVDAGAGVITLVGKVQAVVPGKITGRQIEFEATAKTFDNTSISHQNITTNAVTVVAENNPGTGTAKYAINLEWFTKGYKYEVYRQTGYPADFNTPYYADSTAVYNAIHIKYFEDRISPGVEKQNKVITILVAKPTDDLAGNSVANSILGDIRTALTSSTAKVAADLAVI